MVNSGYRRSQAGFSHSTIQTFRTRSYPFFRTKKSMISYRLTMWKMIMRHSVFNTVLSSLHGTPLSDALVRRVNDVLFF